VAQGTRDAQGAGDDHDAWDAADDHARELAEKLKMLAAVDPDLAREWVSELVGALNRTTGGTFGDYLSPAARLAFGLPERSTLGG
jgi:hypothetical protein